MRRVDTDLERLQPVATPMALECKGVAVGRDECVDFGKGGRGAFAEIGPEDAGLLDDGVGALLDALAQLRAHRLRRRLDALAGGVEQPAMKSAAQPAMLEPSEGKIRAAMRAMAIDQPIAALLVAEQHEVFAEQLDGPHWPRPFEFIH